MLSLRNFNIFQKSIVVNSLVLSRAWYTSHTYPLSKEHAKCIENVIFPFIWKSKSNPLKRDVLYNNKDAGGLNLLNVFFKAKSIFAKSFLRLFLFSAENDSLVKYYCALQINPLLRIRDLPHIVSYVIAPFYASGIDTIRNCCKMRNFPNITSCNIYEHILIKQKPRVEEQYSLFNWKIIWENVAFKFICSDDRSIVFKYIHEILPNKLRLYNIKRSPSPNCDTCNKEENNLHMMYYCDENKILVYFLRELLQKVVLRNDLSLVKLLFLDTTTLRERDRNSVVALVTNYICTVWYNRGHNGNKLAILKKSIISKHRYHCTVLRDKMPKIFNDKYCQLDEEFLEDITILNN